MTVSGPSSVPQDEPVTDRIILRPVVDDDLDFLRQLYVTHRLDEFLPLPWPEAQKRAMLAGQFEMQYRQYDAYPGLSSWLVLYDGEAIGRLLTSFDADVLHLVDVLLDGAARGRGVGSALLRWLQQRAIASGAAAMELHVMLDNTGARRLYERLGFEAGEMHGAHLSMRWRVPARRAASS